MISFAFFLSIRSIFLFESSLCFFSKDIFSRVLLIHWALLITKFIAISKETPLGTEIKIVLSSLILNINLFALLLLLKPIIPMFFISTKRGLLWLNLGDVFFLNKFIICIFNNFIYVLLYH